PVKVDGGYALAHVIKLFPAESMSLEEARPQLIQMLRARARNDFKTGLQARLMDLNKVEINQEILSGMLGPAGVAPERFHEEQ
ncbi:MAG: hypothetical protein ABIH23_00905, partial [bacterium]